MSIPPYKTSPELLAALDRAKRHVMTPEEVFEQRVSFVYGMSNSGLTKDEIRDMLAKSQGRPPIPDGYVLVPRKPTEAMLKAGIYCDDLTHLGDDDVQMRSLRLIWSAMLDAVSKREKGAK